jgi:hypothetical protein
MRLVPSAIESVIASFITVRVRNYAALILVPRPSIVSVRKRLARFLDAMRNTNDCHHRLLFGRVTKRPFPTGSPCAPPLVFSTWLRFRDSEKVH